MLFAAVGSFGKEEYVGHFTVLLEAEKAEDVPGRFADFVVANREFFAGDEAEANIYLDEIWSIPALPDGGMVIGHCEYANRDGLMGSIRGTRMPDDATERGVCLYEVTDVDPETGAPEPIVAF